jgi:hypothetical protein
MVAFFKTAEYDASHFLIVAEIKDKLSVNNCKGCLIWMFLISCYPKHMGVQRTTNTQLSGQCGGFPTAVISIF